MIAIVITAYNRPEPLKILLNNLLSIQTCGDVIPLVISIDNSGTSEVNRIAEEFVWPFGKKEVIVHKEKKGLVKHFIWTGDQTEKYDNIIFLEDDLFVSPEIYVYTKKLIQFYQDDDKVAAASLYNPILIEATGTRFYQVEDGYDVYFLQQPYWGHVWMKEKWLLFKKYLDNYIVKPDILPSYIASWEKSFKKIYIQYLLETDRFVVTPRVSLVTNNGVAGLHSSMPMYQYQCPLLIKPKDFLFSKFAQSSSVYDAFFEITPSILKKNNELLAMYDFEVDINGIRFHYEKKYVLTTRNSRNPIVGFTALMKPTELACLLNNSGQGLYLSRVEDIIYEKKYERARRYRDISKNYYIGFYASVFICKDLVKMPLKMLKRKMDRIHKKS